MYDLRWQQRFQNFERAFLLLKEAMESPLETLSDLEKEGVIQRFEYTFELAWKTLKDYIEYMGIKLEQIAPRQVIKEAFTAHIIEDGQIWIDMLEHRNLLSHTYDRETFLKTVQAISDSYYSVLEQFYHQMKERLSES
jgi:nucleotidyltransferase substrate binding protein (TIGR01987 family)